MMRHWNENQENLYQKYAQLGKMFIENSKNKKEFSFHTKWELITQEGIWKLPVSHQYGGMDLSWQEGIIAVNGLMSITKDYELLPFIIKQFTTIYLALRHSSLTDKKIYLPRLISGELVDESFFIKSDNKNFI